MHFIKLLVPSIMPLLISYLNDNFFDITKYAGEGNIGHILEEIKVFMNK